MISHIKNAYSKAVEKIKYMTFSTRYKQNLSFINYPEQVIINTIDKCNLACIFCPLGQKMYKPTIETMDFSTFQIVFNKILFVKWIGFFNWGEPFLNPHLFDMIWLAKKNHKHTVVHSNFSLQRNSLFFNKIIFSELDELNISCNGASQKSYEKYHINGNFKLVVSNMKKLRNLQKKYKKESPKIIWKFLVHRYNEHELVYAQHLAKSLDIELKFDFFRLGEDLPDMHRKFGNLKNKIKQWLPRKNIDFIHQVYRKNKLYPLFDKPCPFLFSMFIINTDGSIFPCCYVSEPSTAFGNLITDSFNKMWNNHMYQYSRSIFKNNNYRSPKVYTICEKCKNYTKL